MIIVMNPDTPVLEIDRIIHELQSSTITPEKIVGQHKVIIGLVGDTATREQREKVGFSVGDRSSHLKAIDWLS